MAESSFGTICREN